jgi:hypothetical protein
MNSIGCLIGKAKPVLLQYGAIIRLDLDTFLTPRFVKWWPVDGLYAGHGSYVHGDLGAKKLIFLAEEMGMKHLGKQGHNLGSTWYGPSEEVIAVGELTLETVRYLIDVEFAHQPCWHFYTTVDADFNTGVGCDQSEYNWALGFYPGTALLLGGELAINHSYTLTNTGLLKKSFGIAKELESLDCHTGYPQHVCETAELHTFTTDGVFSKYMFSIGKYDNVDASTVCSCLHYRALFCLLIGCVVQLNISVIHDYALYLALKGNGMTDKVFPRIVCD